MTDDGDLVWSSTTGDYFNLNIQSFDSKPVLTYWNGTGSPNLALNGHGYGQVQIFDSTYTELYNLCLSLDLVIPTNTAVECQADLHESYVTDRGSILVTAYNITQADLTSINGPADGWIYDCLVFEIDIKTQEILFSWSAFRAGIPISDSKLPLGSAGDFADPFDFFHINSIQNVGDSYLINSRYMWTSYMIDSKGEIEWQFEGSTGGDFKLPSDIHFAWEHHLRALDVTSTSLTLHMFGNANADPPFAGVNQTLGLMFNLDLKSKTSTLLKDLYNPNEALHAESQGALNLLPNGNVLMGYGQIPVITEYGPLGDVRMNIAFGDLNGTQASYRAYRLEWEGIPAAAPVVVAQNGSAYMSWNGATCVKSWDIYEGTSAERLRYTKTVSNAGFETGVLLSNSTTYVQVTAVTANFGKRYSSVVSVS